MGGKSSKTVTTTDIQNEISSEITNLNKNITDILNKQLISSTMSMVNELAQTINMTTGGGNTAYFGDINVSGKGVFKIDQKVDVISANKAVANITQDSNSMAKLATELNASVMNKIQNDSTLTQAMESASDLQKLSNSAGGLADMLATVQKTMESVLTPGTTNTSETNTIIKNKVKTSISNTNINENKIHNIVEAYITNSLKQENNTTCNINTSASNQLVAGAVKISDSGEAIFTQVANVNALNECVLGATQIAKMVTDITSNNEIATTTDTGNKNSATQSMAATTKMTETTITNDAFGKMVSDIFSTFSPFSFFSSGPMGMICCVICVLMIGLVVLMPMLQGGKGNENK